MKKIRFGIIGCGAVTENVHLPVVSSVEDIELAVLVDRDLSRAQKLADQYNVTKCESEVAEALKHLDAAIVAVPHHLHEPIAGQLLKNGIHVLVEKPMAMNVKECRSMNSAAKKGNAILTVGLARRFYPASIYIKQILDSGLLGEITDFDFQEGSIYNWPVASDFIYRKESGGGVLADSGSHVLDLLLWWLGDFVEVEYFDDALGGVEADCELHLTMKSEASGSVTLSRIRDLRNTYKITGTLGALEVEANYDPEIKIALLDREFVFKGKIQRLDEEALDPNDIFRSQFLDFVNAIRKKKQPLITGEEGARVVRLIESCYSVRKPMNLPWIQHSVTV